MRWIGFELPILKTLNGAQLFEGSGFDLSKRISFLGGFLSITLIDKRINHFFLIAKNNLRIIFTISFFSAVAYTLVLFAYKYSEVSLVSPLREVQTAIAAIRGIVLLKEELKLYKIIGVSLIVVGAVLITY